MLPFRITKFECLGINLPNSMTEMFEGDSETIFLFV